MTRRLVQWFRRTVGHWLVVERNRRRWEKLRRRYD
jgi:hypothetical protein